MTLCQVAIQTGRTHQIRVHLSAIGHPIVGDATYGGRRARIAADLRPVLSLERAVPPRASTGLHASHRRPEDGIRVAAATGPAGRARRDRGAATGRLTFAITLRSRLEGSRAALQGRRDPAGLKPRPTASRESLLRPERCHRLNCGRAARGNDGRQEGAHTQRQRRDRQRERIPELDAVELRRDQTAGAHG